MAKSDRKLKIESSNKQPKRTTKSNNKPYEHLDNVISVGYNDSLMFYCLSKQYVLDDVFFKIVFQQRKNFIYTYYNYFLDFCLHLVKQFCLKVTTISKFKITKFY